MKKFETPTMDIEDLKIIDVITTSVEYCDNVDDSCIAAYGCPQQTEEFSLRKFL